MALPVDLDAVRTVLRAHGVVFALVFGSHATGTARPDSDLDLAVWPSGEYDPPARIHWQADTRKRHLDEAFRRERFRQDFIRAHG